MKNPEFSHPSDLSGAYRSPETGEFKSVEVDFDEGSAKEAFRGLQECLQEFKRYKSDNEVAEAEWNQLKSQLYDYIEKMYSSTIIKNATKSTDERTPQYFRNAIDYIFNELSGEYVWAKEFLKKKSVYKGIRSQVLSKEYLRRRVARNETQNDRASEANIIIGSSEMLDVRQKIDYIAIYNDESGQLVVELVQVKSSVPDDHAINHIRRHHKDAARHFNQEQPFLWEALDNVQSNLSSQVQTLAESLTDLSKDKRNQFESNPKDFYLETAVRAVLPDTYKKLNDAVQSDEEKPVDLSDKEAANLRRLFRHMKILGSHIENGTIDQTDVLEELKKHIDPETSDEFANAVSALTETALKINSVEDLILKEPVRMRSVVDTPSPHGREDSHKNTAELYVDNSDLYMYTTNLDKVAEIIFAALQELS